MQVSGLLLLSLLLACRSGQSPSGEGLSGSGQNPAIASNDAALSEGLFAEPELEIIATDLDVPWGMDLLPDGQLLVAERNGRISRIDPSTGTQTELARRPALDQGEGGLLGLVLDPEFASRAAAGAAGGNSSGGTAGTPAAGSGGAPHPYLYIYETMAEGNRVVRLRLDGDTLREDRVLLTGIPKARYHNGGVLRFGPDGYLYIGTGDGRDPFSAQDPNSLAGKILRMTRDGGGVGGAGAGAGAGAGEGAGGGANASEGGSQTGAPAPAALVYSLGHRNVQGLAWDAAGTLYATEHGPSGEINGWCCHDEVNRIVPGGNYGWPHVIGDQTREGCLPPLAHSGKATWAPGGCGVLGGAATGGAVNGGAATSVGGASGTTSSSGSSASNPTGSRGAAAPTGVTVPPTLLVAGLRGQNLQLFDLQTGEIQAVWFQDRLGRLRNVLVAPDGSVYFCSSNRDGRGKPQTGDDKIYRIRPGGAFRGPEAR